MRLFVATPVAPEAEDILLELIFAKVDEEIFYAFVVIPKQATAALYPAVAIPFLHIR